MNYYEVNGIHIMKRLLSSYMMAMEDYDRSVSTCTHYQTWPWLCNTAIGLPELSSRGLPIQEKCVCR